MKRVFIRFHIINDTLLIKGVFRSVEPVSGPEWAF